MKNDRKKIRFVRLRSGQSLRALGRLICCPRRGQNGIGAGDRNRGQGQHPCTPFDPSVKVNTAISFISMNESLVFIGLVLM